MIFSFINYIKLTNPGIFKLLLVSGITALIMVGSLISKPEPMLLVLIALALTGCAMNALQNDYVRDVDFKKLRTGAERTLPFNQISLQNALYFSILISVSGYSIFINISYYYMQF